MSLLKRKKIIISIIAMFIAMGLVTQGISKSKKKSRPPIFNNPTGITTDGKNLYICDTNNQIIREVVIVSGFLHDTAQVITLAGTEGAAGSTDGNSTTAKFNGPTGIATDGKVIYIADTNNHTIRKIIIATGALDTLAGTAGSAGSTDGPGTAARFNKPAGILLDGANLFVTDSGNNTVRKIVIATGEVSTLAGTAGPAGSTDGPGTAARFNNPIGITSDGSNLYIADSGNNTIRKIVIDTGEVATLAGTAGRVGSIDGTGTGAAFNNPWGITTDGKNIFLTDTGNNTIRKIVIASGVVTTVAARLSSPHGIVYSKSKIFICNSGRNEIGPIDIK